VSKDASRLQLRGRHDAMPPTFSNIPMPVAKAVVDPLEGVHIEKQQRKSARVTQFGTDAASIYFG
jgi:hypothetical protein